MYLLDTNILLELLLDQEKAKDVESFLKTISGEQLFLSEFTLFSTGIVLIRKKLYDAFHQVVDDLLLSAGINLVRLDINEMNDLVEISKKFNLDFDDAYQYAVALKYDLVIVSYDGDFDRTQRGRKTPADIMKSVRKTK